MPWCFSSMDAIGANDGPIRTILSESGPTAVAKCLSQCSALSLPCPSFVLFQHTSPEPPPLSCFRLHHEPPPCIATPSIHSCPDHVRTLHTYSVLLPSRRPSLRLATIRGLHHARLSPSSAPFPSRVMCRRFCRCLPVMCTRRQHLHAEITAT